MSTTLLSFQLDLDAELDQNKNLIQEVSDAILAIEKEVLAISTKITKIEVH